MSSVRIAIVGAGLAGSLLAWRLARRRSSAEVTLYASPPARGDATSVSGGLVRGFETSADAARQAAESIAELLGDPLCREAAGYREIGSLYLLPSAAGIEQPLKIVDDWLPGSATLLDRTELCRLGLRNVPAGAVGVRERRAGYLSPARLRDTTLARLGPAVQHTKVTSVAPLILADGSRPSHDVVVVAAGAWTPRLVDAGGALRTKHIQYAVCLAVLPTLGAFVDELTGLYGRPLSGELMLLGVPTDRWDVDPAAVAPDPDRLDTLRDAARQRFAADVTPVRWVASADCYTDLGGLALRQAGTGLFTFTGGSGGAAKTALAASRQAAAHLIDAVGA